MFAPANAAHFTLVIPTVRNDFKVLALEGIETISALYSVDVDLVSKYPDIDLENLLNQPAFLQFGRSVIPATGYRTDSTLSVLVQSTEAERHFKAKETKPDVSYM